VQETAPEAQSTPAPQAAAAPQSDGELPFTGFAVVTTLLLGIALLGSGLVLRRNSRKGFES
jgi:LPXTG-motif cell wall-anchored protein